MIDRTLEEASARLKVVPTLERRGSPLADPSHQISLLDGVPLQDELAGDFDKHLAKAGGRLSCDALSLPARTALELMGVDRLLPRHEGLQVERTGVPHRRSA